MDTKPIHVLLIEDDQDDALLIQEMLAEAKGETKFSLERVNRLSPGLERLAKGGIDVILSDLNLPDSQGLETFLQVYAQTPEIPIIIVSSLGAEPLAISAVRKGAQDYLCKEELNSFLLVRSLLYALERKQIDKELRKHRHRLEELVKEEAKEILEIHDKLIDAEKFTTAALIASETAHEIRNPLTVIKAGIYYLKQILPPEHKGVREILPQMDTAVERAVSFINDLLYFAKPQIINMKVVKINDVIEGSFGELPKELLTGIEVTKELAPDLSFINAAPDRLKQVFVNLIKNAAEAMKKGKSKKLEVRSEEEDNFIRITIRDTGKGIPEKNIKHIFDPFFTTKGKGIGLGMAICQHIIEAHKGKMAVTSKVGEGTTVVVTLKKEKREGGNENL